MLCAFLVAGEPCGAPAESYRCLPLCDQHKAVVRLRSAPGLAGYAKAHAPEDFPGYVYVANLGERGYKIGYSNTFGGVSQRLKKHAATYGQAVPELILCGGYVQEWVLHNHFAHLRDASDAEVFRGDEVEEWVDSQQGALHAVQFRSELKQSVLDGRAVLWHKVTAED